MLPLIALVIFFDWMYEKVFVHPTPTNKLLCADEGHMWSDAIPGCCARCHDQVSFAGPVRKKSPNPYR